MPPTPVPVGGGQRQHHRRVRGGGGQELPGAGAAGPDGLPAGPQRVYQDGGGVLPQTAVLEGQPLPQRDRVQPGRPAQTQRGDRRGAAPAEGAGSPAGRGGLRPLH